ASLVLLLAALFLIQRGRTQFEEQQRKIAEGERSKAEKTASVEKGQREEEERLNRRVEYADDMVKAQESYEASHLDQLTALLDRQNPAKNGRPGDDLCGFEWYYWRLRQKSERPALAVFKQKGTVGELAFSPRGNRLASAAGDRVLLWDLERSMQITEFGGRPR